MKIKVEKISPNAVLPKKIHEEDAGYDLYSIEMTEISPGERKAIPTGLKFAIPTGFVGLIWDRSGLALNNGLKTMAGVVDSGYRGEVKIVAVNLGKETIKIEPNTRIAQLLIQKIENFEIEETRDLGESPRGRKGFGSSGVK